MTFPPLLYPFTVRLRCAGLVVADISGQVTVEAASGVPWADNAIPAWTLDKDTLEVTGEHQDVQCRWVTSSRQVPDSHWLFAPVMMELLRQDGSAAASISNAWARHITASRKAEPV